MRRMPVALIGALWMTASVAHGGEPSEPVLQRAARALGANQGVFVQADDGTVLAAQAADWPVAPASVAKVASTLALLERLGPGHRLHTTILAGSPPHDGLLGGNLVGDGGGDPSLVYENAFLMLRRLRAIGVRAVAGDLVVRGPFVFNWHPDPDGARFRLALSGRDGAEAWAAVERTIPWKGPERLSDAGIAFADQAGSDGALRKILVHRSPPLLPL